MPAKKVMFTIPIELLARMDRARQDCYASRSEYIRRAVTEYMGDPRPDTRSTSGKKQKQLRNLRDQAFALTLTYYKTPSSKVVIYELLMTHRVTNVGQIDKHLFVTLEPGSSPASIQTLQRALSDILGEFVVLIDGFVPASD